MTKNDLFIDTHDSDCDKKEGRTHFEDYFSLCIKHDDGSTATIGTFTDDDAWFYPEEMCFPHIVNVFRNDDDEDWQFNVYDLPDNYEDIMKDTETDVSIHDIMIPQE